MRLHRVRVLIVDNDSAMRKALRSSLSTYGYEVEEARSGQEAIEAAGQRPPGLVLLDVDMPGINGTEACRRMRAIAPQAGVVMLTVSDGEEDKVRALEAGADDYITKPFSLRELHARLRAIARRLSGQPTCGPVLEAGDLKLDIDRSVLRKAGAEVHLSPTEFALLRYLMQHTGIPIEHTRLLRAIWGPEYGCELEYLRTYIKRLRRKIESDAIHPEYLLTVPWMGYRFCDPNAPAVELRAAS